MDFILLQFEIKFSHELAVLIVPQDREQLEGLCALNASPFPEGHFHGPCRAFEM